MTTRDQLVSAVESYSKRPDLTSEIETLFIPIAAARLGRDLKCAENETQLEVIVTTAIPIPYPDDYGQIRAIDVARTGGAFTLRAVDLHTINNWSSQEGVSGPPEVYTAADSQFIVRPSQNGTFTLYYWAQPLLPDGSSENAVLDRWLELYLYATLVELHRWEVNPDAAAQATQVYQEEIQRINRDAGRALGDKPAMRLM
ncbi:MAG: hypothetical protein KAT39_00360 [Alphaproteobacteria bacterium]|nr:hypothetical protein [Alphaproteobacteria bacterium]